jgi:hypothetical protein
MNQELEERLAFLEDSKQSHFTIVKLISDQFEPVICIYAFMVIKRSLSLVFGFATMLRNRNFLCAAPLIRLQIDNLLRFRAAFLVVNQRQFVVDVIEGKEVRKLIDRDGRKMTDSYLQEVLSSDYPWIKETYKKTSGYVHLSEKHFYNTVRPNKSGQEGAIEAYIGPDDKLVSDEIYQEALEDMILITHSLLTYLADWITITVEP